MKVKISFASLMVFISIFVYAFSSRALAQTTGPQAIMTQNKIRTCLKADPTITKKQNRDCRPGDKNKEEGCERWILGVATNMHLTGSCEAPNGCEIWHENGARPVSGVKAGMRKVVNHVPFGPVNINVGGEFRDHVGHWFYAIGDAPIVAQTGEGGVDAENQTQQVGQVSNFEFPQSEGSEQKCTSVYWDPFGRVFDAVSLEPISGVSVSLFQSPSRELVLVPNNPTLTDKDGVYNILIDTEDDYFMNVSPPETHLFTEDSTLNSNYDLIYSNIYRPGQVFHEVELPSILPDDFDFSAYHHDIPLQPKGEPYRGAVAEVIEESLKQIDMSEYVDYWGRVTFPLAKVCLVAEISGTLACGSADKYGVFNLSLNKLSLPQELIKVEVEKVNLTDLN